MMELDIKLAYEMAKFNGEATLRRRLGDKGVGVFGNFSPYMPMKEFTSADFLSSIEKETPIYFRFARMTDLKSNADSLRDLRIMDSRFFAESGNYDLISRSSPISFISDTRKLPQLLDCLKPEFCRDLTNYSEFWKFISDNPETTYMLLWLFSNHGTAKSYRNMCFYSMNTYIWVNKDNNRFFVRTKWEPLSGIKSITRQESEFLAGFDPNVAIRDLADAIDNNEKVEFELTLQILPVKFQEEYNFDVMDGTRIWTKKEAEPIRVGKAVINRMAEIAEEENIQINPRNVIPGIELSQEKMQQIICMAITDEGRQRFGKNFKEPLGDYCENSKTYFYKNGEKKEEDFYSQARDFYLRLPDMEKNSVIENILDSIMFVDDTILENVVNNLTKVDEELGAVVSMGLDL